MTGDREQIARDIARRLAEAPGVRAVVIGGSQTSGYGDALSDIDLYVYADAEPPLALRAAIVAARAVAGSAELDKRHFEPCDQWLDQEGVGIDVMYRAPAWIEDRLAAVIDRHEPQLGYTTCLWFNVCHSAPLQDPEGWFERLQTCARAPYPEALARAICAYNGPMVRGARSSFLEQLELAGARGDTVASNHRTAAFLACWFDMLFAASGALHPGEKRIMQHLRRPDIETPKGCEPLIRRLLAASASERPELAHCLADGIETLVARRLGGT